MGGINHAMASDIEKAEREQRAERLKQARRAAGFRGATGVAQAISGLNIDTYKAHEQGRNGFGLTDAKRYARAFRVSLQWLNFGLGSPDDPYVEDAAPVVTAPLISWVSAGAMETPEVVQESQDAERIAVGGLDPNGEWIALRIPPLYDSMDRISPPESVIIVNLKDRRLVSNACYVIADAESGEASYKRYRANPPRWEPVSTNPSHEAMFLDDMDGEPRIIGRVRRSMIDM